MSQSQIAQVPPKRRSYAHIAPNIGSLLGADKSRWADLQKKIQWQVAADPTIKRAVLEAGQCDRCHAMKRNCDQVFPCAHCAKESGAEHNCTFPPITHAFNSVKSVFITPETHPHQYKPPIFPSWKAFVAEKQSTSNNERGTQESPSASSSGTSSVSGAAAQSESTSDFPGCAPRDRETELEKKRGRTAHGIVEKHQEQHPDDHDMDSAHHASAASIVDATDELASHAPPNKKAKTQVKQKLGDRCIPVIRRIVSSKGSFTEQIFTRGFEPVAPVGWTRKRGGVVSRLSTSVLLSTIVLNVCHSVIKVTAGHYYDGYAHKEYKIGDPRIAEVEARRVQDLADLIARWKRGEVYGMDHRLRGKDTLGRNATAATPSSAAAKHAKKLPTDADGDVKMN